LCIAIFLKMNLIRKVLLSLFVIFMGLPSIGHEQYIFSFTGLNNTQNQKLDSIKIINRTQQCDTVLYWPDTVLNLTTVDIDEHNKSLKSFLVMPAQISLVDGKSRIVIQTPTNGMLELEVIDIYANRVFKASYDLREGRHQFCFAPGKMQVYLLSAHFNAEWQTIKMVAPKKQGNPELSYIGQIPSVKHKDKSRENGFCFSPGDTLQIDGYADTLISSIIEIPEASKDYTLQFAFDIPCTSGSTVLYEGQLYNTVQIFNQCWLQENLNVGEMIQGNEDMIENQNIEKWCYQNNPDNCEIYGGLYQWSEAMQYSFVPGAQGICPDGWHIPTDEEWKILEGQTDSQYHVGNDEWNDSGWRGFDVGMHLKSSTGWTAGGNGTALFGFNALPAGGNYTSSGFDFLGYLGNFWSSTSQSEPGAIDRGFSSPEPWSGRWNIARVKGNSVRCIKNNEL
jgi:uncharacterized protein (TIGR02145 family)